MENDTSIGNVTSFEARLVITVTSGFGALVAGVVLTILLCTKSYKSFLQRIFIWIIMCIVIVELCRTVSIGYLYNEVDTSVINTSSNMQDSLCGFLGFVSLWFDWCAYIFCSVLIAYLLFLVCKRTKEEFVVVVKFRSSKSSRVVLELGIVVGVLLAPVTVLWVPYYLNIYGFNGVVCRFHSETSKYYDFFVYTPVEMTGIFALLSSIGMAIVYCTLSKSLQSARRAVKNLLIMLFIFLAYKLIFTVMKVVPRALKTGNSLTELAITRCFHTIGKFVLIIGYLIAFHFSKFCEPIKKLAKVKRADGDGNKHQQQHRNVEYKTFNDSSRESAPSSTFFNVSYTGQFTNITKV